MFVIGVMLVLYAVEALISYGALLLAWWAVIALWLVVGAVTVWLIIKVGDTVPTDSTGTSLADVTFVLTLVLAMTVLACIVWPFILAVLAVDVCENKGYVKSTYAL
jgi:hypothetical protein